MIPLDKCGRSAIELVGGKARNLGLLIGLGYTVPRGACLMASAYSDFISDSGISAFISYEMGRKPVNEMRWEEMWDASLRIRNRFMRAEIPSGITDNIFSAIADMAGDGPYAVRSSSVYEDSGINSFAGLHESVLNVGRKGIPDAVRRVWASLWSDSAIAYSKELELVPLESTMSVVIQEMTESRVSGVAFSHSPADPDNALIEAVPGLNKGLVDGDVEPDSWTISRSGGNIVSFESAGVKRKAVTGGSGVKIIDDNREGNVLSDEEVLEKVFAGIMDVEKKLGFPADMEWTICDDDMYLLQVRPITTEQYDDPDSRRRWDMSLRRSFNDLRDLAERITGILIPQMITEADQLAEIPLANMDDEALSEEITSRKEIFDKWKGVYWDEFIPFAHGVRLFGKVYNDKMSPEDPYEFVDLLASDEIVSIKRNSRLQALAGEIRQHPGTLNAKDEPSESFRQDIIDFINDNPGIKDPHVDMDSSVKAVAGLLKKMSARELEKSKGAAVKDLEELFIASFPDSEKSFAAELLELARTSYRLRDDDNVYLGRIETELERAMALSRERLGEKCVDTRACVAAEEVILALKDHSYMPSSISEPDLKMGGPPPGRKRQLRGQPAGKGIARGRVRVIKDRTDLFAVEEGDILVCDSIDPEMTFVIPVVGGIVERRGGMLIHGAIIAREYGLPCVTGVTDAAEVLKDGDDVTVDGFFGLVTDHSVGERV